MKNRKLPKKYIEARVWLYELKEYGGFNDKELAKLLCVTERTIQNIRADPGATSSANLLRILDLRDRAIANY